MAGDNDEIFGAPPRKAASSHEIEQSLDDLSVQEIDERITTLQAEITRLEEARRAKQTSLSAAAAFFKFDESGHIWPKRRILRAVRVYVLGVKPGLIEPR